METLVEIQSSDEVLELFGRQDQFLKLFRERFHTVSVVARNGMIKLSGDEQQLSEADRVLRLMLRRVRRRETLTEEVVRDLLGVTAESASDPSRRPAPSIGSSLPQAGTRFRARTEGQKRYLQLIDKNAIVFSIGPAGTGKTFLAMLKAVEFLRRGDVDRLVLCRPAVEAGEKLGFLPGDFQAKVNPYLRPLYDALYDLLDRESVKKLIEREVIEIVPLAYMRGRTLNGSFIILDEAQNTTAAQMKMFLTRMGEGSRIVVTGDATQMDLPPGKLSGLEHARRILPPTEGIAFHWMRKSDIVRHPLVWKIVQAYERAEKGSGARRADAGESGQG